MKDYEKVSVSLQSTFQLKNVNFTAGKYRYFDFGLSVLKEI